MRSIFCLLVIAIGGTAVAAPPHYRIVAEEWEAATPLSPQHGAPDPP
ncbi:MAG: hypothetical protein JNM86_01320 [Phycisphaerae bacterium]|nr:hypothetical protein [Phycisphaerae bacterium]